MSRTHYVPLGSDGFIPTAVSSGLNEAIRTRYSQRMIGTPEEQRFKEENKLRISKVENAPGARVTAWMTYVEKRPEDTIGWAEEPRRQEIGLRDEFVGDQFADWSRLGAIKGNQLVKDTRAELFESPPSDSQRFQSFGLKAM